MTDRVIEAAPETPGRARAFWLEALDLFRTVAVGLAIAMVLQTALFQPFTIPSSSMEPGLVTGDYIVVSKFPYGWSRASLPFNPPLFNGRIFERTAVRGDVVVFRLPRDPKQTWIKRVIGLPGDRIQVRGGVVFVNGRALPAEPIGLTRTHDDPTLQAAQVRETQPNGRSYVTYDGIDGGQGDDTGEYVVPEGFYFMMGDNRDNSLDSRWPRDMGVGLLPAGNIVGRAELVVASWRPGASLFKPWTWLNLQPGRFLKPVR